jgi:hypothetical protein
MNKTTRNQYILFVIVIAIVVSISVQTAHGQNYVIEPKVLADRCTVHADKNLVILSSGKEGCENFIDAVIFYAGQYEIKSTIVSPSGDIVMYMQNGTIK